MTNCSNVQLYKFVVVSILIGTCSRQEHDFFLKNWKRKYKMAQEKWDKEREVMVSLYCRFASNELCHKDTDRCLSCTSKIGNVDISATEPLDAGLMPWKKIGLIRSSQGSQCYEFWRSAIPLDVFFRPHVGYGLEWFCFNKVRAERWRKEQKKNTIKHLSEKHGSSSGRC